MIRRFIVAEGDNNATTTRVDITPTTTNGTQIISTGFAVSWAIITGGGPGASQISGPFYFDADGSTQYSVTTLTSDEYTPGTLKVFLNGQLLDNNIQFTEDSGGDLFNLKVGAGALESAPAADDTQGTLPFTGQTVAFTVGATLTQGGVTATITEVSNDTATTGQLNLTNISPGGSSFTTAAISDSSGGAASAAGTFQQGGDRLGISYRPKVVVLPGGIEVFISSIYPDLTTGLELTFRGATPSEQFTVDLVYR